MVQKGEGIIMMKAGKPIAKVVPYDLSDEPRRGGQWHGRIEMADDFDDLTEDIASAFL
jgi:antitoxin (DNA-binding transcriptional repressor) of toxin-antitoxin stability system